MPKLKRTLMALGAAAFMLPSAQAFAVGKDYFAELDNVPFLSVSGDKIVIRAEKPESNSSAIGELVAGAFYGNSYSVENWNAIYEGGKTKVSYVPCDESEISAELYASRDVELAENQTADWTSWSAQYSDDGKDHYWLTICTTLAEKEFTISYTGIDKDLQKSVLEAGKDISAYVLHDINAYEQHERPDLYEIADLGFINYVANGYTNNDEARTYGQNSMIKYSSDYQKDVAGKNVFAYVDNRAGSISTFTDEAFGMGALISDGTIYETYGEIGGVVEQVVFIPEKTTKNHDAYIEAALARIKEYYAGTSLANAFDIKFGGDIEDIRMRWDDVDYEEEAGETEYYKLYLNGKKKANIIIVRNDDGMVTPDFYTEDLLTGASIKSSAAEIPLDAQISVSVLDEDENADLAKTIGVDAVESYDLKLNSDAIRGSVTKLENGKFLVSVPISASLAKKGALMAYYVADDGTIERREATVKDGFAIFETDHFSTYAIGEATEAPEVIDVADINPATLDSIRAFGLLSLLGSAVFTVLIIKNRR